jgi:hypothetical protein
MTPDGHRMVAAANYSFFFGGGSVLEIYDNVAGTNGLIQVTTNTARPRGVFASPRFSADGSMVFFTSNSPDLPGGNTNTMKLYSHDLAKGATRLLAPVEVSTNGDVFDPAIDGSGSVIAFTRAGRNIGGTGESSAGYILRLGDSQGTSKVTVTDSKERRITGSI